MSLHAFPSATASPWRLHFTRCSAFSIRHGHPSNPFLSIQSDIRQEYSSRLLQSARGPISRRGTCALLQSRFSQLKQFQSLSHDMSGNDRGGVQRFAGVHANDASRCLFNFPNIRRGYSSRLPDLRGEGASRRGTRSPAPTVSLFILRVLSSEPLAAYVLALPPRVPFTARTYGSDAHRHEIGR
jgi:hypothetical protein